MHAQRALDGRDINAMVATLDAGENLPAALCSGLALPMAKYVGTAVRVRFVSPAGDSADGALRLASMAAAQSPSMLR
ncbi:MULTISPECIES: hypothetical protein [Burkholderiaceae]|uniref:hypothetical protein n=1 Tax=Burkholderiaceae TaxID=119060 RepID=UPI00111567B4|nr:hypothetical protein [Mycetohabitans sp. B3]MCF2132750.1 hypothetical protein [Mycetohabitans sp. B3]MCG1038200.1 hypothetical protein [Mycetohabitans sp. B7]